MPPSFSTLLITMPSLTRSLMFSLALNPYYTVSILLFQITPFIIIPWLCLSRFMVIFNFIFIFRLYYLTLAISLTFCSPRLFFKLCQRSTLNWCLFPVRFELWNICLQTRFNSTIVSQGLGSSCLFPLPHLKMSEVRVKSWECMVMR